MAVNLADSTRNAGLDAYEADLGASPILEGRSGAKPANCAAADSGALLWSMALPADAMAAASGGTKVKSGTWEDLIANAAGTHGHFRLKTSGGVCKMQGSCGIATGVPATEPDLTVDVATVAVSQVVRVTAFTWTAGNV